MRPTLPLGTDTVAEEERIWLFRGEPQLDETRRVFRTRRLRAHQRGAGVGSRLPCVSRATREATSSGTVRDWSSSANARRGLCESTPLNPPAWPVVFEERQLLAQGVQAPGDADDVLERRVLRVEIDDRAVRALRVADSGPW